MRRVALVLALLLPFTAFAGMQKYEPLSESVRAALSRAISDQAPPRSSFLDSMDAVDWLTEMSRRLEKRIANRESRLEFLRAVHYEATRAGLDPQLVLGLIQVESDSRNTLSRPLALGASCRSCPSGSRSSAAAATTCSTYEPICATAAQSSATTWTSNKAISTGHLVVTTAVWGRPNTRISFVALGTISGPIPETR